MNENQTGTAIIDAGTKVHSVLGPGLLESAYRHCMVHELSLRGLSVRSEVPIAIRYEGLTVTNGYRVDIVVNDHVLVELKALETVLPVHRAQLLSYLRLGRFKLGYLLNFHVKLFRDGISRIVNGL